MSTTPRSPRTRRALATLAVGGGILLAAAAPGFAQPPPPPDGGVPPQPLTVKKTAVPSYVRVNTWSIDKWTRPSAKWDRKDNSLAVDYFVEAQKHWRAERVSVRGEIAIHNPNERVPFLYEVGDDLPGADCSIRPREVPVVQAQGQDVLPAPPPASIIRGGETVVYQYLCVLDGIPEKPIWNTGWVKFWPVPVPQPVEVDVLTAAGEALSVEKGYAKDVVKVDFAEAEYKEIDPAVRVIDTIDGDDTKVLAHHLTDGKIFKYTRYLKASKKCRYYHNVARLFVVDGENGTSVARMVGEDYALTKTAEAWVKICPPKGDDPQPPVVVVSPGKDDTSPVPVDVKPGDNPTGPVIKDPKSKGKLVVTKSLVKDGPARIGDVVTWTITVKNAGKSELYGVVVTDLLPKHLAVVEPKREATRRTKVVLWAAKKGESLKPGAYRTFTVDTRVVGRPAPTPVLVEEAKRIKTAKERNEALRRLRRGLICNVVFATARNAKDDRDVACLRIARPERPAPDVAAG